MKRIFARLGSIKIGQRLRIAFALVIGLLLAVAVVSLTLFNGLSRVTQTIVDVQVRRVFLAQEANHHAQRAATCLLKLLQTTERARRIALYGEMDAELAASDAAVEHVGRTLQSAEDKKQLERLNALRDRYDDQFRETVETIELHGTARAREHFDSSTQKALDALLAEMSLLAMEQQQRMRADLDRLKGDELTAEAIVVVLSLAALLASIALAWFITRSIVVPVGEAVGVAKAIADGDLSKAVPAGGDDEVGQLLHDLEIMRASIQSREEKILRLAYEDSLTGLANRTRFIEAFGAEYATSPQRPAAVVVLDIDRFSLINNALGHKVGDRLLREVGQRLQRQVALGSVLARIWGNQFAFLLPSAEPAFIENFVEAILALLRDPIMLDDQRLDVAATLGIALYPADGGDATILLRRAELAMRSAKQRRRSFAFGADVGQEPAYEQLSLIGKMREALARREFIVHYQPKLNFATRCVDSAEALLRWLHPEKGLIPPGQFIPFAEQTGFIREITPWLIELVIGHAAQWRRNGLAIVPAVNLSTHDLLNGDLVDYVDGLLRKHGLAPSDLCLEITESALMEEPEIALKNLNAFSALGVKLSIDDYGSGQASLAYIQTLPVDELKIDRVFVTDVTNSRKNGAIVRSTIVLCHELGLSVVAEGAETDEEIVWLRQSGCDRVQGYGVARPMPLDAFLSWVERANATAL
ncbi:MAG TPA: EAL domain-containing protein [Rhodocyclaceae bacterium]|nr:EAL domain-containing protein [Rhodocyclaceae bacterium]